MLFFRIYINLFPSLPAFQTYSHSHLTMTRFSTPPPPSVPFHQGTAGPAARLGLIPTSPWPEVMLPCQLWRWPSGSTPTSKWWCLLIPNAVWYSECSFISCVVMIYCWTVVFVLIQPLYCPWIGPWCELHLCFSQGCWWIQGGQGGMYFYMC